MGKRTIERPLDVSLSRVLVSCRLPPEDVPVMPPPAVLSPTEDATIHPRPSVVVVDSHDEPNAAAPAVATQSPPAMKVPPSPKGSPYLPRRTTLRPPSMDWSSPAGGLPWNRGSTGRGGNSSPLTGRKAAAAGGAPGSHPRPTAEAGGAPGSQARPAAEHEPAKPGASGPVPQPGSNDRRIKIEVIIGAFNLPLTTDTVQHLPFVQETFAREASDFVQVIS